MHHLHHRSIADIAVALDKSEDAVKSNLYRARRLLLTP
jgi:DNA-directed RNA polymerase specialized sigma24 family protein